MIQVKVCLPGPDRDCWLRRAHSLLEADFPGAWHCWCVCPQLMCLVLSCFAETSPPGSLCPLQRCAVVSQLEDHGMLVVFPEVAICGSTHSWSLRQKDLVFVFLSLLVHLIMCRFSFLTFSSPIFYFHLSPCLYLLAPQWVGSCRKTLTDQWKVMSLLSRWSAVEAVSCALVYCGSVKCWAMFFWISNTVSGFFQWPAVAAFNPCVLRNLLVSFFFFFFFTPHRYCEMKCWMYWGTIVVINR